MANNEYTINILNADQLYVEGKRIQQLDLGTLVEKAEGIGIGINNSFPRLVFDISGTDGLRLPSGTTSNSQTGRPTSNLYDDINGFEGPYKLTGVIRFNKDTHKFEGWTGLNTNLGIGLNDNSWGSFVQEDNDNNRLKLSNGITNMLMHDFKINTKEKEYSVIGNNLGNYSSNNWTNKSKGPASYISLYGGEDEKSQINFHTSSISQNEPAGTNLGTTQRMTIIENGHIAIGDNFTNATSRVTIKGQDKFPDYSTTAVNPFGNAFNGNDGYGQLRLISNTSDSSHLDIGASSTVGSPGTLGRFSSYLQSQTGGSPSPLLLQPTGGNIGIGEIDPDYKLDVNGDIRLRGLKSNSKYNPKIIFTESSGATEDFFLQYVGGEGTGSSGNRFRIGSGWNSEAFTILGNGRIGMGRTNPYTKLHVKDNAGVLTLEGSTYCYMQFYRSGGSRTGWFGNGNSGSRTMSWQNQESGGNIDLITNNGTVYTNSTIRIGWRSSYGRLYLGDTNHGIYSRSGYGVTLHTYGVSTGIFLQQSTGRVGIGTSGPRYKLEVIGNGYFSNGLRVYGSGNNVSGSDAVLYVGKPNNNDWAIMLEHYNSDYGMKINGHGPHMIGFYHRNSLYSRINSYGQIERFRPNAGYFIGKVNNSYETNPIYTRSIYYRPGETTLGNMYGIGYSYGGNASFLPSSFRYGNGWGMYVAADGDARIFLDGSRGDVNCTGTVYCGNFVRTRGATGWYNQTYLGGWYMTDYTWIRTHSKPVYIGHYVRQNLGRHSYADYYSQSSFYDNYYFSWGSTDYIHSWQRKSSGRNYAVGLRTPYALWCGSIAVNSDIRIKKDIENVPDNLSLEKLRNIECVYYNYKNEEDNGPHKVIGFIAQQVKQHLPTAVNLKKEVIPNYYKDIVKFKITACDENGKELSPKVVGKVDKSVNLDGNTLFYRDSSRDENIHRYPYDCKCSLIDCKKYDEKTEHYFKLTILDDINFKKDILHRFDFITDTMDEEIANTSVVKPMSKDNKSFIIDFFPTNVLYYGEEVEDFHILDKQRIFALNFSATQEIDKIQQREIKKVSNIEKTQKKHDELFESVNNNLKIHTEKSSNLENQYQESLKKIDNLEKTTLEQKELINTLMESLNELKRKLYEKNLVT